MVELHAASTIRAKNTVPKTTPAGIAPKATGRLTKIRPGPSPALRPGVAKTMGNIASPAINATTVRSEEHTSELQSRGHLVCRLLLEKKNRRCRVLSDATLRWG